jgi:hypothetical protein
MLFLNFYIHGFYLIDSNDYYMYLKKSMNWLNFNEFPEISVSVGLSFLYIPFILLHSICSVHDIVLPFSIFSFIVFGGGGLIMTILIARSLWKTTTATISVAVIACLYPFFSWTIRKGGLHEQGFIAKSQLFINPNEHPFSMVIFNKSLLFSWNALSHSAELFFILAGFYVLSQMRRHWGKYILIGLLFGSAITIRYSALAVLPAVFFFDILSIYQEKVSIRNFIRFYLFFAVCGLFAVSPQLLDNFLSNGSAFIPSVDSTLFHGSSTKLSALMRMTNLLDGIKFYMTGHFKPFLLSTLCLFFIKKRKISLFLWTWMSGILFFYTMMNFYGTSIMRYMVTIYPVFYLIWGGALSTSRLPGRLITALIILVNFIVPSPELYYYHKPLDLPVYIHFFIPLFSIAAVFVLNLKYHYICKSDSYFLITFLIFLIIGSWWIPFTLLCCFPITVGIISWQQHRIKIKEANNEV